MLIFFRHELWSIATKWLRALRDPSLRSHPDVRMGWYLIVATIPIGILGYVFQDQIETGGARPVADRHHADRLRPGPRLRRPASAATSATSSSSPRATEC